MKLFKNWREKAIEEAERQAKKSIVDAGENLSKSIKKINLTKQIKSRIIKCLRKEPNWIMGTSCIYIRTKNHKLAHDVAKELGITLKKTAGYDGFNYNGKYEDINITIYGMDQAVNCKVVSHKELREVNVYETVCK